MFLGNSKSSHDITLGNSGMNSGFFSNQVPSSNYSPNQHLFLTPIRTPPSGTSANPPSLLKHHQLAWTRGSHSATALSSNSNKESLSSDASKDKCEHQAAMYRRILCQHCGEMFCDSCEIAHKDKLKKEILKMGHDDFELSRETVQNRALLVRDHLSKYTDVLRKNVESEIAYTELTLHNATQTFLSKLRSDGDAVIRKALEMRDAEVNDLMAIGAEAVHCVEEKARVANLVDSLRKQQVFFVTLRDMSQLHREIVRLYGLNCAIDALRNYSEFYSDKVLEFQRHPGFTPTLERCVDFFQTVQLGTVKFSSPIKKIREMLSGKQTLDTSPFKPLISVGNSGSPESHPIEFVGKSFYARMHVTAVVSGKDALGWDIRKPFGLVWLPNTPYLAVVHRPKRITLISVSGEVIATYKFADPDCIQAGGLNFHGNLAADDCWRIFFIDEPGLRIFSFDVKANPFKNRTEELALPTVFARLQSCGSRSAVRLSQFSENNSDSALCNKMKFHGLAVGLARRELYTEAGDSIVAFSLLDGSPRFRCLLEPGHQFSSHVLGVTDRPNSISFLIYSTSHGNVLHKKTFLQNGLLAEGSSIVANQGSEMGCVSEVRGVANDPCGNLLLADSKNGCIKVFSENFQVFSSFGYGDASSFNPSGVAVAICGNGKPVVVVTEFSSHRIIFFSA